MQIVTKRVHFVEKPLPYVTQGLIAMWDAEWNRHCGLHSAGYGKLTELCRTGNDLIIDSAHGELHHQFLHCSGLGIAAAGSAELPAFDRQQIEIVFRYIAKGNVATNFNLVDLYRGPQYVNDRFYRRFSLYVRTDVHIGFSSQSGTNLAPLADRVNSISVSCDITNGIKSFATTLYANGEPPIVLSQMPGCSTPPIVPTLGASAQCDIYSIRIYNRQLDTREISHNYNLDKMRFDL